MTAPTRALAALFVCIAGLIASLSAATAHPHVFVDAHAEIMFDGEGRISAVRNIWKFDRAFSAFAIQGLDTNHDGKLEAAELAPLAKTNVTSLKAYKFFTYLVSGDARHPFLPPTTYHLEYHHSRLTLFFTLPLAEPAAIDGKARVEIFDPEYFVAFTFAKDRPVSLVNAPAGCTVAYRPPHMLDASTMSALAAIPVAQHDLPPDLLKAAAALANVINITCPASASAAIARQLPPLPEPSPDDPAHASHPAALTSDAVLASAERAAAATAVRPAAEILMDSATAKAGTTPPAGPVLHIRSEEEIDRARRKAAEAADAPSPVLIATVSVLVIAIAVCGIVLLRIMRRARP